MLGSSSGGRRPGAERGGEACGGGRSEISGWGLGGRLHMRTRAGGEGG